MRIRDIGDAVEQSFSAGIRNNGYAIYNLRINRLAFLEINICADGIPFEVPCIALRDYLKALMRQENPRKLIKSLYEKNDFSKGIPHFLQTLSHKNLLAWCITK